MNFMHPICKALFIGLLLIGIVAEAEPTRSSRKLQLKNSGHKLCLTFYPGEIGPSAHAGPTVVFESGLGGGEWHWDRVIANLPKTVPVVTYGRPGLDGSELDGTRPTPIHIAQLLHSALSQVTKPPYLLVGHSWGGPLIRAFAGEYPDDVAGMVYIDPTDFNETEAGRRSQIFGPLGHPDDGETIRDHIAEYYYQRAGKFSANVQDEIDVSRDERRGDFKDLKGLPMPQVPITIIATTRYPKDNDPNLSLPFDQRKYLDLVFDYRMSSLTEFASSVPDGTLVTTARSGHYVQDDEPDLVNWAIERVLQVPGRPR
jgi:pimeloyl-ACP methyl ester carboxylesterase